MLLYTLHLQQIFLLYRWNKTLFYNKHSKILHQISTVYNPEPVTLNKTLLTNVSAANQRPITSSVS